MHLHVSLYFLKHCKDEALTGYLSGILRIKSVQGSRDVLPNLFPVNRIVHIRRSTRRRRPWPKRNRTMRFSSRRGRWKWKPGILSHGGTHPSHGWARLGIETHGDLGYLWWNPYLGTSLNSSRFCSCLIVTIHFRGIFDTIFFWKRHWGFSAQANLLVVDAGKFVFSGIDWAIPKSKIVFLPKNSWSLTHKTIVSAV